MFPPAPTGIPDGGESVGGEQVRFDDRNSRHHGHKLATDRFLAILSSESDFESIFRVIFPTAAREVQYCQKHVLMRFEVHVILSFLGSML